MASPCLRTSSTDSPCCSASGAARSLSSCRGGPIPSSSSCSSVSVSSGGFRDGLRVAGCASLSSSGRSRRRGRKPSFCVRASIRAVESYDASFTLQPDADKILRDILSSNVFCAQVAEQSSEEGTFEFTGELFQPVPWSPATKFGMPAEYEKYLKDKENFTIINVPPNFMFKAKIFRPSRLCAIFKKVAETSQALIL